jgi:DNA mismatch repair protein MutS
MKQLGTLTLAAFGIDDAPLAIGAAARSSHTPTRRSSPRSRTCASIDVEHESAFLALDPATRRNLEITDDAAGDDAPTLCSLLDECATAAGSRLLAPMARPAAARPRGARRAHDGIEAFRAAPRAGAR